MSRPLISVVIPTYNSAAYLSQAIDSVLQQNCREWELVVVDDGSTDETPKVLEPFRSRIHYLYQENRGVAAARNAGLEEARGDYIAFLDADDVWLPHKLETQLSFLERHPEVGLGFADYEEFDRNRVLCRSFLATKRWGSELTAACLLENAFAKLLTENFIPCSTVVARRSCFETAGRFSVDLPVVEDRDLWLRISARFPIACQPLVLMRKRRHESNLSSQRNASVQSLVQVLERNRRQYARLAPGTVWRQVLSKRRRTLSYLLLREGRPAAARKAAFQSLTCRPSRRAILYFLASFLSPSQLRWARRMRGFLQQAPERPEASGCR